jgi:hypothetical protein
VPVLNQRRRELKRARRKMIRRGTKARNLRQEVREEMNLLVLVEILEMTIKRDHLDL